MLPWLTSAMTLWAVWLSGHNLRLSWRVSLASQALWLGFIVASGTWGLLPLTLSLSAMFASHLARPPRSNVGVRLEPAGPQEEVAVRRRAHCVAAAVASEFARPGSCGSGGPAPSRWARRCFPSPCSSVLTPSTING